MKKGFKEVEDKCLALTEVWEKGVFGLYDPSTKKCQECESEFDFQASAEACKFNTQLHLLQATPKETESVLVIEETKTVLEGVEKEADETPAVTPPKKTKKEKVSKEKGVLGFGAETGAGKCCALLFSAQGASLEELQAIRKGISSLLHTVKQQAKLEKIDGRYYATLLDE